MPASPSPVYRKPSPSAPASATQSVAAAKPENTRQVPFPAQNISVYTISLANVSDSLDATVASKRCRSEVCEFGGSWLDGCCNG